MKMSVYATLLIALQALERANGQAVEIDEARDWLGGQPVEDVRLNPSRRF